MFPGNPRHRSLPAFVCARLQQPVSTDPLVSSRGTLLSTLGDVTLRGFPIFGCELRSQMQTAGFCRKASKMNTCAKSRRNSRGMCTYDLLDLKLEYILDFTRHPCYPFFVLDTRSILARWRLMILWPFFVNKCSIASSVVISFGCFFGFLGMGESYESL